MLELVYLNRIGFKKELRRRESCPDIFKIQPFKYSQEEQKSQDDLYINSSRKSKRPTKKPKPFSSDPNQSQSYQPLTSRSKKQFNSWATSTETGSQYNSKKFSKGELQKIKRKFKQRQLASFKLKITKESQDKYLIDKQYKSSRLNTL